jgi:gas vesicle structural protein
MEQLERSTSMKRQNVALERTPAADSMIDVMDRVLDKGIVIDAAVRVALIGIDLLTVESRIVVGSIETHLNNAEAVALTGVVPPPAIAPRHAVD